MRRRTLALIGAVLCLFAVFGVRLRVVPSPKWPISSKKLVTGVLHVHSERSHDSATRIVDIIAAARQQKRDFVVLTDHDVHTQPPLIRDDLVVLRETELSTPKGHLLALRSRTTTAHSVGASDETYYDDGPQPSDLTRELRNAREIERFGLWAVVAHPDETKQPWHGALPRQGGIEVANAAAQLRALAYPWGLGLISPIFATMVRREALGWAMYAAPDKSFSRWDAEGRASRIGLCGVDSHGWLPLKDELSFWNVILDSSVQWPKRPEQRPEVLQRALFEGRFFCAASLGPLLPSFSFTRCGSTDHSAETLCLALETPTDEPSAFELVLLRDGKPFARGAAPRLVVEDLTPGVYRAEVWAQLPGVLWGRRAARVLFGQQLVLP